VIPRHLLIAIGVLLAAVLGMGIYASRMRGRVTQNAPTAVDTRPIAPPVAGPTEAATLFVANDSTETLHAQGAKIPLPSTRQQRAEEVLRALVEIYQAKDSPHPIAPGGDLRAVYLADPGLAVIDLNAAFANGHRSGVLEEELTVTSLIQTLTANISGILRVKILIEGKERETLAGHADLSNFYDTVTVSQAVGQMQ
jgi:hypothetical protein